MKLFLASADDHGHIRLIKSAKHPYYLTSYYIHRKSFSESWLKWYNETKHGDWIMDSGLFTMMFGAGKDQTYTEDDLLNYTYKYLKDLKSINYNNYIVEMDVHKVLGLDSLKRFRKIFKDNYDIDKTIYVWHIEEGEKGFIELCKTYPYIALSIPEFRIVLKGKNTIERKVKQLIRLANKINPNIKIHLLGCTQQNLMEQKGYYSCDSTSWISGGRYGQGTIFNGNNIQSQSIYCKPWVDYLNKNREKLKKEMVCVEDPKKDYTINCYLGAKAYTTLNKYINNRYYNYEPLKNIL